MCRNLIVMAVVLALASTSYGYTVVVGDWEDGDLDGWENAAGWYAESNATLTPGQTCGVTLNTGCLVVSGIPLGIATDVEHDSDYPYSWWMLRGIHEAPLKNDAQVKAPGLFAQAVFKIDVTDLPEGANLRAFIHYGGPDINYAKTDMQLLPDENGTVTMDYINDLTGTYNTNIEPVFDSAYVDEVWSDNGNWTWDGSKMTDLIVAKETWQVSWYEIVFALESPGLEGTADIQFDNARFETPEPMTIALLGLGGLALIRRKR